MADAFSHTAADIQQSHDDHAPFRRGKGKSASTKYIRKLRADYPTLQSKELLARADRKKLGSMSDGTFRNIAGGARQK